MKKTFLFAAVAVLALGAATLTSCSNKEGVNAANDESVVGSTEGMIEDQEASEQIFEDAPGQLEGNTTGSEAPASGVAVDEVTVEEVVANQADNAKEAGKGIVEKAVDGVKTAAEKTGEGAKNVYEKTKEGAKNAYDKTKEGAKNAYDKTKEGAKNAYDKTREGVTNLVNKL